MTPIKSQAVTEEAVRQLSDITAHLTETVISVDKNLALNTQMLETVKKTVDEHDRDITEQCKRIDGQDLVISKLGNRTDGIESWKRTVNAVLISILTAIIIIIAVSVLGLSFGVKP